MGTTDPPAWYVLARPWDRKADNQEWRVIEPPGGWPSQAAGLSAACTVERQYRGIYTSVQWCVTRPPRWPRAEAAALHVSPPRPDVDIDYELGRKVVRAISQDIKDQDRRR